MSAIISDPEPAIRDQTSSSSSDHSKRNKILLGVGLGALVLGGVGAALALTVFKSKDSTITSSNSNTNTNTDNPVDDDGYARGYIQPQDAAQQLALLNAAAFVEPLVAALPANVDWRTNANVVTPVKNQGGCGSCWAFSAIESMEASYGMKYNNKVILSPQQLIDCDTKDNGCGGGWMMTAWTQYFKNNARPYSLTESQYPYTLSSPNGKLRNTCSIGDDSRGPVMVTSATNIMSTTGWSLAQEQTVMGYIAQNGPVSIAISSKGWGSYRSGIATTSSLGCDQALDHGVALVGFGEENGKQYWIVRNSWSSSWGEAGFIRLARGSNTCCVLCAVMGVTVATTGASTPTSPPTTTPTNGKLTAGNSLSAGSQLTSADGNKVFKVQTDGNLVLYKTIFAAVNTLQAVWASNTFGSNFKLTMQTDCNLVLYNNNNGPVWASGTSKAGDTACSSSYLTVQNDGNLIIYKGTTAIWSTSIDTTTKPTTAPTATPTTARPPAKTLSVAALGCWKDDTTRVLKTKLSAATNAVMRDCAFLAYNAGKTHFGLEYGGECWGGDATYNRIGRDDTLCSMKCSGDSTQTCGGSWALSMYQIVSSTSAFTEAPVQQLPQPVAPLTIDSDCTFYRGFPSYCWRCTNNVINEIKCQDASVANLEQNLDLATSGFVYPDLCPSFAAQNATEICARSSVRK